MINQLHEEHENGKSYLPGPRLFLLFFYSMSRFSLRRVERAKLGALMVLAPHLRVRLPEHGEALSVPAQTWFDQSWVDTGYAHSAIGRVSGTL